MYKSEKFEFANHQGEVLSGRIELPVKDPKAFAIFAHCFTCSKNVKAASRISRALAERGIGVLRFDFTGLGNSQGDFSNSNYSSNVDDLVAAAAALTESYQAPAMLVGHSLGGTACLMAANRIDSIKAVATIGSPADPEHVVKLFGSSREDIIEKGKEAVQLAGRTFTIKKQFLDDVHSIQLGTLLASLNCAVMIYHSPQDELVAVDQARIIYERLKHPKNFLSLDGADHLLTAEEDSDFVASTLSAWAARYIFDPLEENTDSKQLLGTGVVNVRELDGFTQSVRTNDHELLADEPASVGGANMGMTPYDLLLAALGTCTSMTLRMYANHKKLNLESIEVNLSHQQIHAKDCEDCESESGKISQIKKKISVSGDLTPEQVNRLNEIADRCPVHRTLMSEKKIDSTIQLVEDK